MKEDMCESCGGKISEGKATVERWYEGVRAAIIKDVPAGICQFCGQRYYEANIVDKLNIITFDIAKENGLTEVSFDTYFDTHKKEKESKKKSACDGGFRSNLKRSEVSYEVLCPKS